MTTTIPAPAHGLKPKPHTAPIVAGWLCAASLAATAVLNTDNGITAATAILAAFYCAALPMIIQRRWHHTGIDLQADVHFARRAADELRAEIHQLNKSHTNELAGLHNDLDYARQDLREARRANRAHNCAEHLDWIGGTVTPHECIVCGLRYDTPHQAAADNAAAGNTCGTDAGARAR